VALAGLVMLLIVVITRLFRGFISQIAVLLFIVIGTLVAWPMHLLNFSSVHSSKWARNCLRQTWPAAWPPTACRRC
jgi:xanthine/uracil permease